MRIVIYKGKENILNTILIQDRKNSRRGGRIFGELLENPKCFNKI